MHWGPCTAIFDVVVFDVAMVVVVRCLAPNSTTKNLSFLPLSRRPTNNLNNLTNPTHLSPIQRQPDHHTTSPLPS